MKRRNDSWRWSLDPRDPDYEDPPEYAEEEDQEPEETWPADDDPRGDGPYHYIPPYEP